MIRCGSMPCAGSGDAAEPLEFRDDAVGTELGEQFELRACARRRRGGR